MNIRPLHDRVIIRRMEEKHGIDLQIGVVGNLKELNRTYYKASIYNLIYLKKIVLMCKEKNLNLFLIRSPMYKNSYYLNNENLLQIIKKNQFEDIDFLDFKDFPLSNNEYRDLNHLNYKGAKKFSLWFNVWLKDNIN